MKATIMNESLMIKNRVFEKGDIVEIIAGIADKRQFVIGRIEGFMKTEEGDILLKVDASTLYHATTKIFVVEDIVSMRKVYEEV